MLAGLAAFALAAGIAAPSPCTVSGTALKFFLETDAVGSRDSDRACAAVSHGCHGGCAGEQPQRARRGGHRVRAGCRHRASRRRRRSSRVRTPPRERCSWRERRAMGSPTDRSSRFAFACCARGPCPKISVVLTEMNGPTGTSLVTRVNVAGLEAKCAGVRAGAVRGAPVYRECRSGRAARFAHQWLWLQPRQEHDQVRRCHRAERQVHRGRHPHSCRHSKTDASHQRSRTDATRRRRI